MSAESISFYVSPRYGSGCFSLYYGFEDYAPPNYILSTGSGNYSPNQMHSGEIFGNLSAFKDTKLGSGAFNLNEGDDNYIKVEKILEDDDLINNQGWTFLVSQEKIDNSCGTIFSNFAGEGFVTSGWEFGINNANQLYFKYQDAQAGEFAGQPYYNIITLNNTPSAKNYYSITYAANSIELARYDPQKQSWESNSATVNSNYIRNNKDWYIGTGEYKYVGYIDKFAYFNIPLSHSDMAGIINASYLDFDFNNGRESFTVSGSITGYQNVPTGETGVLYSSGQLSGLVDFSGSGEYNLSDPLYGFVPSGQGYFSPKNTYTGSGNIQFPETGQFYYREIADEDLYNVVTGFSGFTSGFTGVTQKEVYINVDVTGVISSGSGVGNPLYSPDETFIINEGKTILTGEGATGDYSYNPDTLSYKGQRGGDYVEYILNSNNNVNYIADYGFSSIVGKNSFFVDSKYADKAEDINLFLNGVYQNTGEKTAGPPDPNNILNPLEPTVLINEGNYVLNNTTIESTGNLFGPQEGVIYDEDESNVKGRLEITEVSQYAGAPFSEIPVVDSVIFFNGQKIYEGVDWQDAGGFTPIGDILTMTGTFVARGKYSNSQSVTVASNDLYDIENPYGENFVVFINGIRAPKEDFTYYSSGVNLIDGRKNLIELPQRELYNITAYKTFF